MGRPHPREGGETGEESGNSGREGERGGEAREECAPVEAGTVLV